MEKKEKGCPIRTAIISNKYCNNTNFEMENGKIHVVLRILYTVHHCRFVFRRRAIFVARVKKSWR